LLRREIASCTAPVFLRCTLREGDAPAPKSAGLAYPDNAIPFPGRPGWPPDWATAA